MDRQQLGERIRELRRLHNISRRELADGTGISVTTIANYENGHSTPRMPALIDIATFFKMSIDALLENRTLSARKEENRIYSLSVDKSGRFPIPQAARKSLRQSFYISYEQRADKLVVRETKSLDKNIAIVDLDYKVKLPWELLQPYLLETQNGLFVDAFLSGDALILQKGVRRCVSCGSTENLVPTQEPVLLCEKCAKQKEGQGDTACMLEQAPEAEAIVKSHLDFLALYNQSYRWSFTEINEFFAKWNEIYFVPKEQTELARACVTTLVQVTALHFLLTEQTVKA